MERKKTWSTYQRSKSPKERRSVRGDSNTDLEEVIEEIKYKPPSKPLFPVELGEFDDSEFHADIFVNNTSD